MSERELVKIARDFSSMLAKRYKIKKVYLFGSLAEGRFFKGSDVDIAVAGMNFEDYLKALAEHRSLRGVHLDILNMDFCKAELKKTILKNGTLLYGQKN